MNHDPFETEYDKVKRLGLSAFEFSELQQVTDPMALAFIEYLLREVEALRARIEKLEP